MTDDETPADFRARGDAAGWHAAADNPDETHPGDDWDCAACAARMRKKRAGRAMTAGEAVREVAWVVRRARELAYDSNGCSDATRAEYREFFARKIALLWHIGTPEALALIPSNETSLAGWSD